MFFSFLFFSSGSLELLLTATAFTLNTQNGLLLYVIWNMDSFIYILHMLGSNINSRNIAMSVYQPKLNRYQNFVKSLLLIAYRRKLLEL